MHMADALISPAVGLTMWVASAGTIAYCSKKLRNEIDDKKIPLMGVLGAFVFAAQMINFTIPGTGSSGHLGGGMILAVLLGPHAAFLGMASILTIQAFLFADGGLLALGCNIFNLGIFPCFIAYPFIYQVIAGDIPTPGRISAASMTAAIVGLQMGAFGVVLETFFSGISELPFASFTLAMQSIHLAIGIIEGLVTAAVINFVRQADPEILAQMTAQPDTGRSKKVLVGLLVVALFTGGLLSWFASSNPDGLEWSMSKVSGKEELNAPAHGIHGILASLQEKLAFFPDYGFKKNATKEPVATTGKSASPIDVGTTVSGLLGGIVTLAAIAFLGFLLKKHSTRSGIGKKTT